MRELTEEMEPTLEQQWLKSDNAFQMLLLLPRESWPRLYLGLKEYVTWLFGKKDDAEGLADFYERLANADSFCKERIASGEISECEAETHQGEGIWWIALEETNEAALFIAIEIMLERDILAHLEKGSPSNAKTLHEIQKEVENELAEKLRSCVDIHQA